MPIFSPISLALCPISESKSQFCSAAASIAASPSASCMPLVTLALLSTSRFGSRLHLLEQHWKPVGLYKINFHGLKGEKTGEMKRTNSEEKMMDKDDATPPPTDFIYNQNMDKLVKVIKKEEEKIEVDELPQGLPQEGFAGLPGESHECTEEVRVTRKAFETCPSLEEKSKNYDPNFVVLVLPCQKSRKAIRPKRLATTCQKEAMTTRKVLKTGPNSVMFPLFCYMLQCAAGDKSKNLDPNFVVLALPCQNSRRAAAPRPVAAQASFVRAKDSRLCPPPPGVYKINFHGFSFSEFGDVGIGIVVRDFRGDLIAAMLLCQGK